jgi:hypothetical protein
MVRWIMNKWILVFAISILGMGEYAHYAVYPFKASPRQEAYEGRQVGRSAVERESTRGLMKRPSQTRHLPRLVDP